MSAAGVYELPGRRAEDSPPAAAVVLVCAVGSAAGSREAAAALACAASEPDRAALLVDLDGGRAPRPTLLATAGARALEERLVSHLPDAALASRGAICRLSLPGPAADGGGSEPPAAAGPLLAALPLTREAAAVLHLPPCLLQPLLAEPRLRPTAVLLRADLPGDRALTALAARDLIGRGLRVAVLKRSLAWLAGRAALLGALPPGAGLPARLSGRLLSIEDKSIRGCYDREDERDGRQKNASGAWKWAAR